MRQTLYQSESLEWIDVSNPSPEEAEQLAQEFDIHSLYVQDCLDPSHMPKFESFGSWQFIILRIHDAQAKKDADTVHEMTRKIAVFFSTQLPTISPDQNQPGQNKQRLITVHRLTPEFSASFFESCRNEFIKSKYGISHLIVKILVKGLRSYHQPLQNIEREIDDLERLIYKNTGGIEGLEKIQTYRRQLSIVKRILFNSRDVVLNSFPTPQKAMVPHIQDLKENLHNLTSVCDELLEDLTSLITIQLSIASQKTNEVVRILTVFSVFFMPLTFIVGVYGMNFHNMPELTHPLGYAAVWGFMIIITIVIAIWFYRRSWIEGIRK